MLTSMLIEDAIAAAPTYLQPPIEEAHAKTPFTNTRALLQALRSIKSRAIERTARLWQALQEVDKALQANLLDSIEPHELAVAARWRRRDPMTLRLAALDDSTAPFGETLLHCAAFAGHAGLVRRLLEAGAKASRTGTASLCTPLHSAAAGGHAEVCSILLAHGVRVNAASATRWTALHKACLLGYEDVATTLVEAGADPYVSAAGAESPMSLLRRLGDESAALLSRLDELCRQRVERAEDGRGGDGGDREAAEKESSASEAEESAAEDELASDDESDDGELSFVPSERSYASDEEDESEPDDEGELAESDDDEDYEEDDEVEDE